MRVQQLGDLGTPPDVLRALATGCRAAGRPGPAALTGDWFDSQSVIAPSLTARPVLPHKVFEDQPTVDGPTGAVGGGWIGYLAYPDSADADDAARRVPQACGGWTDAVLRRDSRGRWWYESLLDEPCPPWILDAIAVPVEPAHWFIEWQAPARLDHRRAVHQCLSAIASGEVYQACVCTQFRGELSGDPLNFFADAVAATRPARAAFLSGDWGTVASLSPELFLRRNRTEVASSPIKGTLPAAANPSKLLASAKDVAENVMITDLVRNDLGRVADIGTVRVPDLLTIHPAPGVWHLVSTVTAQVSADTTTGTLLDAAFPPASVTGTPKTRARQLLSSWERQNRGVYCGAVGMISPAAGLELNVAIRTVEFAADGTAVLGVGGGITADSDPDAEWQECLDKAAATIELVARTGLPSGLSSAL